MKSPSVEECGERLKRILESPSIPQANQQLLVHLSRHLARVGQHSPAGPRLLGQSFAELVFKNSALSADVKPEHHVRILEALIATGGLLEMQTAPVGRRKGQTEGVRLIAAAVLSDRPGDNMLFDECRQRKREREGGAGGEESCSLNLLQMESEYTTGSTPPECSSSASLHNCLSSSVSLFLSHELMELEAAQQQSSQISVLPQLQRGGGLKHCFTKLHSKHEACITPGSQWRWNHVRMSSPRSLLLVVLLEKGHSNWCR
ncbi:unnamed protein product [Pleuronectes platessa]|uniref:Rho-GAP domain-containing protein n=1 Tax=Pleuronectes platessa TaxID=8262 RepID=A0A9N7YAD1_PLEPL|nr:unnamed protein product [Pleuronectes platessa]